MRLCVIHGLLTGRGALRAVALAGALLPGAPVAAQMQLVPPAAGTAGASSPAPPALAPGKGPPSKPTPVKPPGEEAVLGHLLLFEGAKGAMQFDRADKDVVVTKLTLPGERLSKPAEACAVNIVGQPPVVAAAAGHPEGALRWHVAVEACPFSVDVLDGAALVSSAEPSCDFVAADCRVNPVGLWGPPGAAIPPARIKELERERVRSETAMRGNFRVLLQRAGKDRAAVKALASEQAAFSSQREITCRDYARETVHGFCSAQVTQARSLALLAKMPAEAEKTPHRRPVAVRARPAAPAQTVPPAAQTPPQQAQEKP